MEYKLTTIKDIFDKVPADRIEVCCKEIGLVLTQAKQVQEIARGIGELQNIDGSVILVDEFTWIDDDKGEIGIVLEPK